jgi:hypothetical protein
MNIQNTAFTFAQIILNPLSVSQRKIRGVMYGKLFQLEKITF